MADDKKYMIKQQKKITRLVTSSFKDYYLTGGTALAFYYNHRFSEDLDFFTQKYSSNVPDQIMDFVSQETGLSYRLDTEQVAEPLFVWYHSFNRTRLKGELMDLVPGVDTLEVLDYLDNEILKRLPKKLL